MTRLIGQIIVLRILEVNGKLVVGAGRTDLARLLAVAPDAAQIVVLRKGESLAALRTLRSDNLRLTHRIGYLEEEVKDLLAPSRTEVSADPPSGRQEHVQVFRSGEISIFSWNELTNTASEQPATVAFNLI